MKTWLTRLLLLFAVSGVDPKPMSPNSYWYKYYTYLPKEEGVDDGQLIQTGEKVYEANPFGLYNMHGNVSEWTTFRLCALSV